MIVFNRLIVYFIARNIKNISIKMVKKTFQHIQTFLDKFKVLRFNVSGNMLLATFMLLQLNVYKNFSIRKNLNCY